MKQIKYVSLMLILVLLATGCAGNYGIFKGQTRSESKTTKKQLIHNWSDYDIWYRYHPVYKYKPLPIIIIIFDTKNDHIKILAPGNFNKVNDQEMWTEIVKKNTADDGEFTLAWPNYMNQYTTGVQEIWGPDNQLYGYVVYQQYAVSLQRVEQIDENTIRISWSPPRREGSGR